MKSDYLIVHKKVLPDYFEKVVEAREMLRRGTIREVKSEQGLAKLKAYASVDFGG